MKSLLFLTACVLSLLLPVVASGATVSAENGGITFDAPADFAPLSVEAHMKRYTTQTIEAVGNADVSASISYGLKPVLMAPDQLARLKSTLPTDLLRIIHTMQWIKSDLLDINGTQWVVGEYISHDLGSDHHNLALYTSYRGLLFEIIFAAPSSQFDDYSGKLWASAHSLKLKDTGAPPSAGEYMARGELAGRDGKVDEAEKNFRAAIAARPGMIDALVAIGSVNAARDAFPEAIKSFSDALVAYPQSVAAAERRALAQTALGNFDDAIKDINLAVSWHPELPEVYEIRSRIEMLQGNLAASRSDLDRVLQTWPQNAPALRGRGWLKFIQGDIPGAAHDFRTALLAQPRYFDAAYGLACTDLARHREDDALLNLQREIEIAPTNEGTGDARLLRWTLQARQAHLEEANAELATFLSDELTHKKPWVADIGAYLLDKKSETELIDSAHSDNPFQDSIKQHRVWFFIGMKRLAAGDQSGADEAFRKCIACKLDWTDYTILSRASMNNDQSLARDFITELLDSHAPHHVTAALIVTGVALLISFFVFAIVGIVLFLILRPNPRPSSRPPPPPPPPVI